MDNEAEIMRLREWRHETDKLLWAVNLQLRELVGNVTTLMPEVKRLGDAERIATEVAKRLRSERTVSFSRWQQAGAFLVGCAIIADALSRFVH